MITLVKLRIYASYDGDGDMFARAGRKKERLLLRDSDWYLIDILLQDATVIDRHLGSEQRTAQAWQRLQDNCENADVINETRRLAAKGL